MRFVFFFFLLRTFLDIRINTSVKKSFPAESYSGLIIWYTGCLRTHRIGMQRSPSRLLCVRRPCSLLSSLHYVQNIMTLLRVYEEKHGFLPLTLTSMTAGSTQTLKTEKPHCADVWCESDNLTVLCTGTLFSVDWSHTIVCDLKLRFSEYS
ncbi:hypothetical protein F2P81_009254 [Scophthalmus maximus]|uniref:Secreted protein n=1 Tax=Scophthalmus maximus TaxID=52904 RepID=A0A6A4T421_SCOMX|nr:hypothetical protein F2P81_009254 [Scophthalmus maximus]